MTAELLNELAKGNKSSLLKKRIITFYIYNGNSTITELAKVLDLSIPTVTKLVEEMCQMGLVNSYGKLETSGGRHPLLYGLNPDACYFIGVDIRRYALNIGLINFTGELIEKQSFNDFAFENTMPGLDRLCDKIRTFIDSLIVDKSKILNICVNVSGRVNPESGYSYSWFNFGEIPLSQLMTDKVGFPVSIDNDTRAMTYGEYLRGNLSDKKDLLFINVSWGLGVGIIINGKIYSGMSGFAGEFGHIPVFDNGVICHCGKKGCLETEASGCAIYRHLVERVKAGEKSILSERIENNEYITLEMIIDAINREDALCIELLEEAGYELGKHIAGLMNLFNPEMVIIGGVLSSVEDYLTLPIKTAIKRHSLNMVNKDTLVKISSLRERAGMIGACMLARSRVLDINNSL
ncbi:MAG: ROK family transcriptional regulator [Bacteroidales bacterium]|nr:ROK family transcriptional regulator [Bacteroidales bacterium]